MALKLQSPSCFFVSGPTASGKSLLVRRIIRHRREMFERPQDVEVVYYAYKEWQPLFDDLQRNDSVHFHEGLPSLEQIKSWAQEANGLLLIIDDLSFEATSSKEIAILFGVVSHHCNVTAFLLTQNLFPRTRFARDLCLNSHYLILLNSKRDKLQISNLGRQLFPGQNAYFMSAFESVTSVKYGYLLVDLHPATERKFMLRSDIFPNQLTTVHLPK